MSTGKNVRVEIQKSNTSNYVGASGSIEISDAGKVFFNVDNGPSISVELPDLLETVHRAVTGRK